MIVLASASPRRRALLSGAGLVFEVDPAHVDETVDDDALDAADVALLLAERKALAVAARRVPDTLVLGADTVVALPTGRLLGKPADADEAGAMLAALSGTRHRVITGVSVVPGGGGAPLSACETTWVVMRAITPPEAEAYVATGEWRDKAGGYAIQENADAFVTALEGGGFDNVVGLPVALTLGLLRRAGATLPPVAREAIARDRGAR